MPTESARDRHQTITEQSIIEIAAELSRRGRECVALYAFR
jgi:hypothetical protein